MNKVVVKTLIFNELDTNVFVSAQDTFTHIEHLPWAMLLDTCNSQQSDSRYSIIVAEPNIKIEFKHGETKAFDALGVSLTTQACPLDTVKFYHQLLTTEYSTAAIKHLNLPFCIGALGLFAYDINTQLENIANANPHEYETADMSVGIYTQSIIFDHLNNKVFHVYADDNISSPSIKTPSLVDLIIHQQQENRSLVISPFFCEQWQSNSNHEEYFSKFSRIQEYLYAGDCYQINFAQRFTSQYSGSEWQAYQALRDANNAPFSAFIRLGNSAILSVSPERFLKVLNGQVETKPIKGTIQRGKTKTHDESLANTLLNSEKDRAENLMIVDLLRNDLSKHCKPHSVEVPVLFALESYPAVHHLVSTVLGELQSDVHPIDLFKGAFPGGSITGAPKVRAMQIIEELEPNKRNIYCGSIGYIGINNDMDTSICIRTVLAENGHLYCWAGGGIVLDSKPQSEYDESLNKVSKILPVLSNITKVTGPNG